jgi:urocanate hydratase
MTCDPGIGVLRHVDAGYQAAIDFADRSGLHSPMRSGS